MVFMYPQEFRNNGLDTLYLFLESARVFSRDVFERAGAPTFSALGPIGSQAA